MNRDRLNSPETSAICLEVSGHQLQFAQDPNSKHLGTTVWDSSMVLVKFLEKNSKKGKFCPSKLKGKRVIELGAGCGVAGFGMALLGCDVVATDQVEVLPLLMRNVERNTSRILQTDPESFGSIEVAELDWGNEKHIEAVDPPFDYIIGTDVVYAEHLLELLLKTICALAGPKTSILLGYEIRSTNVHEQMLEMWRNNFNMKTIPRHKMHSEYQHPSIQLYVMDLKFTEQSQNQMTPGSDEVADKAQGSDEIHGVEAETTGSSDDNGSNNVIESHQQVLTKLKEGDLSEWEVRRYGSMAARLLRDERIA